MSRTIEKRILKPPTEEEYRKAIIRLADQYLVIRRCRQCQWPIVDGYICIWCGEDENP